MKNTISLLFLCLIFIFSCNTEQKFGFRKKIKVEENKYAETIAKSNAAKPELKIIETENPEIAVASVSKEKIILPEIQKSKSLSFQKIFERKNIKVESIRKKRAPIKNNYFDQTKINKAGFIGFILSIISLLGIALAFVAPEFLFLLILGIPAFILCLIGLIQIAMNPDEYKGIGYAFGGIFISLISITVLFILLSKIP